MLLQRDQRQQNTQRIDPKIILANSILQLSAVELSQSIESELMENPALESMDDATCAGDCIDPTVCPYCMQRLQEKSVANSADDPPDLGDQDTLDFENSFTGLACDGEEDLDPVGNLGSEVTLREHLTGLLRSSMPDEDHPLGLYLINNLNDRGWLGDSIQSIALDLNVSEAEVVRVLRVLQSFDPPGIGARDLQECLLIQLTHVLDNAPLEEARRLALLARLMVANHFDLVPLHRYPRIAKLMSISIEDVKSTLEYIGSNLNPYPANQFRPPWSNASSGVKSSVRPDVVIRRTQYGYEVDVVGSELAALNINPLYRHLYNGIKAGTEQHPAEYRKHVLEYVERAELFIRTLKMRRQSLRQITRCIVDCQTGFLETGSRQFIRPLTRTHVARLLSIHESTVSRATANKFVQLPNQEVVSYNIFFNASLSVKDAIETMIQEENPAKPLSDQKIVELLAAKGIPVARRTVVKYRTNMKILSSARRRR